MSLLDTASLIVTPNGYKEGTLYSVIPSDGSGDMSVVRATTATRVNSAGLVELVPYNLLSYSEDFSNVAWTQVGTTITANSTTAPNGTLTADTIAWGSYVGQNFTHSGVHTFSVYAKYIGTQWLFIENYNFDDLGAWFDIQNGVVGTIASGVTANIESVGNGWYRCSITMTATSAYNSTYAMFNTASNGSYSRTGSSYFWGGQINEGSLKDYQKTETRLNIPRLDYSNGTCPSLLVEPQRTNLLTYSEQFDNLIWVKDTTTITANATVSPSGITNADKIIASAIGGDKVIYQIATTSIGTSYTSTAYYKSAEYTQAWMRLGGVSNNPYVLYNLTTGTLVSSANVTSSSIESVGNGWYKVSATVVATGVVIAPNIMMLPATGYTLGADNIPEFTGNNSDGGYLWGAQLEAGTYPTSYIPTTSASVTRNADVISKTGISSLIGQTEGTMFLDIDFNNIDQLAGVDNLLILNNGTNNNEIVILLDTPAGANKTLLGLITNGGSFQSILYAPSPITATRYKIALAYKNNDVAFYINGSLIGTDTSATIPTTSAINFKSRSDGSWLNIQQEFINASAIWKTRLTNTQLAQLTTI